MEVRASGWLRRRVVRKTAREASDRKRSRWFLVVPLTVATLTAGCAVSVGGTPKPAPGVAPRTLTGQTVGHVLLGDAALSRILKQPLDIDPHVPARFGGSEQLDDAGTALTNDCLGAAAMLQQSVYPPGDVEQVAVVTWRPAGVPADVTNVTEGVVSLPTAAEANALFATFSQQWQKCDGATTSLPGSVFTLKGRISNVQVSNSVVAATVSMGWASRKSRPHSDRATIPAGRAIAVRGNCLIEVEVDFFTSSHRLGHGLGDYNNSAIEIARAMMDKVGELI